MNHQSVVGNQPALPAYPQVGAAGPPGPLSHPQPFILHQGAPLGGGGPRPPAAGPITTSNNHHLPGQGGGGGGQAYHQQQQQHVLMQPYMAHPQSHPQTQNSTVMLSQPPPMMSFQDFPGPHSPGPRLQHPDLSTPGLGASGSLLGGSGGATSANSLGYSGSSGNRGGFVDFGAKSTANLPVVTLPLPTATTTTTGGKKKTRRESWLAPVHPVDPNDKGPRQLIVNYIASEVNNLELFSLFEQFGPVECAKVIQDKKTFVMKGFGFVYFASSADAHSAMDALQGFELYGKFIRVGYAVPQRAFPAIGGYRGHPKK